MLMRKTLALLACTSLTAGQSLAADRPDRIGQARVYVARDCPITPATAIQKEMTEKRMESLGLVLAGIAGELVKTGLNAAGAALEKASREQGFGAEGTASYLSTDLKARSGNAKLARIIRRTACLVLFTQDDKGADIAGFGAMLAADPDLEPRFAKLGVIPLINQGKPEDNEAFSQLKENGAVKEPGLYVEARILTSDEGTVIRPVLVRYARALPGAPDKTPSAAELHVTLAVPGNADLGTPFATVRLKLPKIRPGQTLGWDALRSSTSVVMASRPTAGTIDTALTGANAAYTAAATRKRERIVAERALAAADAKLRAKPLDTDLQAVRVAANNSLIDANDAEVAANDAADGIEDQEVGATNVSARFVVIRAENAFGMALAKLLQGQAETAGKAVTETLTPKPEFTANDTAYLTAEAALAGKQREYDAAMVAGNAGEVSRLLGELNVAKAKVNEAAVAIKRSIPYPGLL